MAEVIELLSDDEDIPKSKSSNAECVNFKCSSGIDMGPAPIFACLYYGANLKKKKKRVICAQCFEVANQHQQVNTIFRY